MVRSDDYRVPSGRIQPEDYTVLYIREPDELVLMNAHPPVVQAVRSCLGDLVDDESSMSRMAITFSLVESFFRVSLFGSSEQSYKIKRVLGEIIHKLQSMGWILLITSDLGQLSTNSGLFFRRIETPQPDHGPFICIAPSSNDK